MTGARSESCTMTATQAMSSHLKGLHQRLEMSEGIRHSSELEFEAMCKLYKDIKTVSRKSGHTLDFGPVLTGLIRLVEPNDFNLDKHLSIFALKTMRKLVEMEVPHMTNPAVEWAAADWQEYRDQVLLMQGELNALPTVPLVVQLVHGTSGDKEICREAVLLAVTMLLGGNSQVQASFHRYCRSHFSDGFFAYLQRCLGRAATQLQIEQDEAHGQADGIVGQAFTRNMAFQYCLRIVSVEASGYS